MAGRSTNDFSNILVITHYLEAFVIYLEVTCICMIIENNLRLVGLDFCSCNKTIRAQLAKRALEFPAALTEEDDVV